MRPAAACCCGWHIHSVLMEIRPVTLDELLQSRDNRRDAQCRMLAAHPGNALISFTVVIPGAVKRSDDSLAIARAGLDSIDRVFGQKIVERRESDLHTGFEALFSLDMDSSEAKTLAERIEDEHPLGRLMDIDVFRSDGMLESRRQEGRPSRRCLLCGDDARVCMRLRRHTVDELLAEIHRRVQLWNESSPSDCP